jgi:hypothetical protein
MASKETAGFVYLWRQIKLAGAMWLFSRALALTPADTPEYGVLAEAALRMPEACRKHESFEQFKARQP